MIIADDGRGFNDKAGSSGNGLHNIRQRADYLAAEIVILSEETKGTKLILKFKIPANEGIK